MQLRILEEVGLPVGYMHSSIFVVLSHLQVKGTIMIWWVLATIAHNKGLAMFLMSEFVEQWQWHIKSCCITLLHVMIEYYRRGINPPHRVKSVSMASFTQEEVDMLIQRGNEVSKLHIRHIWGTHYDIPVFTNWLSLPVGIKHRPLLPVKVMFSIGTLSTGS